MRQLLNRKKPRAGTVTLTPFQPPATPPPLQPRALFRRVPHRNRNVGPPETTLSEPHLNPDARVCGLVDLDRGVDAPDEEKAADEAREPGEDEEGVGEARDVAEEDAPAHPGGLHAVHARHDVVPCIQEKVHRRGSGREVRPPPPVVILGAKLEVAHDDGDLGARDDEDQEHEAHEAEQVVEAVLPYRAEDEEELDKDDAKGEHARHHHRGQRLHVPHLLRDLAGNGVGADGGLDGVAAEAEEGAEEDEGEREPEPEHQDRNQRRERHRAGGAVAPEHQVEEEEDGEDHAWEEGGGHEGVAEAVGARALEHLAEDGRDVARGHAHQHEEQQHADQQRPPVRRR
mmetsp:Transcript_58539/g.137520  ORF Transcript_58539/g.137520 Transcript_58539/m.137520 type:complete len:343 (+) Transcript_58539:42-1070(+)